MSDYKEIRLLIKSINALYQINTYINWQNIGKSRISFIKSTFFIHIEKCAKYFDKQAWIIKEEWIDTEFNVLPF